MAVRRESGRDRWSHPAIYWAAVEDRGLRPGAQDAADLDAEWRKAFGDPMALGQWPEIPERLPALPAPGQTHSREVGKETIQAMLARLKSAAEAHCKASTMALNPISEDLTRCSRCRAKRPRSQCALSLLENRGSRGKRGKLARSSPATSVTVCATSPESC